MREKNEIIMSAIQVLKEKVDYLNHLLFDLKSKQTFSEQLSLLESEFTVSSFLNSDHPIAHFYPNLSPIEKFAICSIVAIGQAPVVFQLPEHISEINPLFSKLLKLLVSVDRFYRDIGGIIGYHQQVISLLFEKSSKKFKKKTFHEAKGLHLSPKTEPIYEKVLQGIESLPLMGEIYPIGGAGDRLDLKDEKTGLPLPTAKLMFLGRTLLEGLIRDLQAREYLYYKLFGKQLVTPIAMMTSEAKNNHLFVKKICAENHFFHRPEESLNFFMQPLAPVLTDEGNWSLKSPMQLFLKPSGHGVMWKIALEQGVFKWFYQRKRPKVLVRQINNPVAGIDDGLFPLIGIGCRENKAFGFASCHRRIGTAEGVNIMTEDHQNNRHLYGITNVEYTDFERNGIKDQPKKGQEHYSIYPSNTNLLFADLASVARALEKTAIPGMLINMKSNVPFLDENGHLNEVKGGRLESTMQNIADDMANAFNEKIDTKNPPSFKTFLTYNERHKTISVTKKTHKEDEPIQETPEGCYYTFLRNHTELLHKECFVKTPPLPSEASYLENGPSFHMLYHPALGPNYSIIGQKIRGGRVEPRSEIQLEATEIDFENLHLDGSFLLQCDQPLGHLSKNDLLHYSDRAGKCTLHNVKIINDGIDQAESNCYWKNHIYRKEALKISLGENSEFIAENVTFKGNFELKVPPNTLLIAKQEEDHVVFESHHLVSPRWRWEYSTNEKAKIVLKKTFL